MKIPKVCVAAFVFAAVAFVHAQSVAIDSLISKDLLLELESSGGRIERTYKNVSDFSPEIAPNTEFSRLSATTWKNDSSKFASENVFLVKKSDLGGDNSLSAVSKIVRSISTMKGIQYYSNGDKKWETLYHEAKVIKSPKDKTALPDETDGSADGKSLFCLLEDNSFGDCIYRVDYHESETEVSAFFENAAAFKYGPIKAVKTGNLNINLTVSDAGENYLVYMLVRAQYPSLPFLESRMTRSFNARVEAMFDWFKNSFSK